MTPFPTRIRTRCPNSSYRSFARYVSVCASSCFVAARSPCALRSSPPRSYRYSRVSPSGYTIDSMRPNTSNWNVVSYVRIRSLGRSGLMLRVVRARFPSAS
jgi:hypothetical protein